MKLIVLLIIYGAKRCFRIQVREVTMRLHVLYRVWQVDC